MMNVRLVILLCTGMLTGLTGAIQAKKTMDALEQAPGMVATYGPGYQVASSSASMVPAAAPPQMVPVPNMAPQAIPKYPLEFVPATPQAMPPPPMPQAAPPAMPLVMPPMPPPPQQAPPPPQPAPAQQAYASVAYAGGPPVVAQAPVPMSMGEAGNQPVWEAPAQMSPTQFIIISSPSQKKVVYTPIQNFESSTGTPMVLIDSGLTQPRGLCLDHENGTLYVADAGSQSPYSAPAIYRYTLQPVMGGLFPSLQTSGVRLTVMQGHAVESVALDEAGNLFYTAPDTNNINKIPAEVLQKVGTGEMIAAQLGIVSQKTLQYQELLADGYLQTAKSSGLISPACMDHSEFIDEFGYRCEAWTGLRCNMAVQYYKYMQISEDMIMANCQKTCGVCHQASTTLTMDVEPGKTNLPAESLGFTVGEKVVIDQGKPNEEVKTVKKVSTLIIDSPLQFHHSPGAVVQSLNANGADEKVPLPPVIYSMYEAYINPNVSKPNALYADGDNLWWVNNLNGMYAGTVVRGLRHPKTHLTAYGPAPFKSEAMVHDSNNGWGIAKGPNDIVVFTRTSPETPNMGMVTAFIESHPEVITDLSSDFEAPRGIVYDGVNTMYVADEKGYVYSFPVGRLMNGVPMTPVVNMPGAYGLALLSSDDPAFKLNKQTAVARSNAANFGAPPKMAGVSEAQALGLKQQAHNFGKFNSPPRDSGGMTFLGAFWDNGAARGFAPAVTILATVMGLLAVV